MNWSNMTWMYSCWVSLFSLLISGSPDPSRSWITMSFLTQDFTYHNQNLVLNLKSDQFKQYTNSFRIVIIVNLSYTLKFVDLFSIKETSTLWDGTWLMVALGVICLIYFPFALIASLYSFPYVFGCVGYIKISLSL